MRSALLNNELKSTPGFDFSLGVDTLRDELLSPTWCMINSACRGSALYSTRSCPNLFGGLTHLTILFSILTCVTSHSAVHGPTVARCLTMRRLDNYSSNSLFCVLVPDKTKSSPHLNTDMATALEWFRQGENLSLSCPIAVMAFSLATLKHCAASFLHYTASSRTA